MSIEGRGTWHSVTCTRTEGVDCEYRGAGHVVVCDMHTDRGGGL